MIGFVNFNFEILQNELIIRNKSLYLHLQLLLFSILCLSVILNISVRLLIRHTDLEMIFLEKYEKLYKSILLYCLQLVKQWKATLLLVHSISNWCNTYNFCWHES